MRVTHVAPPPTLAGLSSDSGRRGLEMFASVIV
jgi:hypothetical protein